MITRDEAKERVRQINDLQERKDRSRSDTRRQDWQSAIDVAVEQLRIDGHEATYYNEYGYSYWKLLPNEDELKQEKEFKKALGRADLERRISRLKAEYMQDLGWLKIRTERIDQSLEHDAWRSVGNELSQLACKLDSLAEQIYQLTQVQETLNESDPLDGEVLAQKLKMV